MISGEGTKRRIHVLKNKNFMRFFFMSRNLKLSYYLISGRRKSWSAVSYLRLNVSFTNRNSGTPTALRGRTYIGLIFRSSFFILEYFELHFKTNKAKSKQNAFCWREGNPSRFWNAVAREGKSKYVVMTGDQYAVAIPTKFIPHELTHVSLKDFSASVSYVQRSGQILFHKTRHAGILYCHN